MTPDRYLEVRQSVINAGFEREIQWAQSLRAPVTSSQLASEAIWVILNSGMKFTVAKALWAKIRPHILAGGSAHDLFNHTGKAEAIDEIWRDRDALFDAFQSSDDPVAWCQSLPWIGPITKYHLAKNLGVDCAKPDRHLERIAKGDGTDTHRLCKRLSKATGDRIATVDMVLWRASEQGILDTKAIEAGPQVILDGKCLLHVGDVLETLRLLKDESVDCVVLSPPYWGLRDYGVAGQMGLEASLQDHLDAMVQVFREIRRVLKSTGTVWLNYGDCYATAPNGRSAAATKANGKDDRAFRDKPFSTVGPVQDTDRGRRTNKNRYGGGNNPAQGFLKPKDLCMVPHRLALALQRDGWWVRSRIIWGKSNPMPDSAGSQRPSVSYEEIFLLAKSATADVWRARDTGEISFAPDLSERCALITNPDKEGSRWSKIGHYYDAEAVKQESTLATKNRLQQDIASQAGSKRANGGSRPGRPMKAVASKSSVPVSGWDSEPGAKGTIHRQGRTQSKKADKKRGHSRRHAGFNDHLDHLSKEEQGANGRFLRNFEAAPIDVWSIATKPFTQAHFATFPPELAERCILAGCPPGGVVLDPFGGAGTTALAALRLGRKAILIELNPDYAEIARERLEMDWASPLERQAVKRAQGKSDGPLMDWLMAQEAS